MSNVHNFFSRDFLNLLKLQSIKKIYILLDQYEFKQKKISFCDTNVNKKTDLSYNKDNCVKFYLELNRSRKLFNSSSYVHFEIELFFKYNNTILVSFFFLFLMRLVSGIFYFSILKLYIIDYNITKIAFIVVLNLIL